MSIPRPSRDQYLKPGACQSEGCTATWDAGPRTQKYCTEHQKAADRRHNRKHYRRHKKKMLSYYSQRWANTPQDKREKVYKRQRERYAARKGKAA